MSVRERESGRLPSPICPCLTERSGRDLLFSELFQKKTCSRSIFPPNFHKQSQSIIFTNKFMGRIYNNIIETVGRTPLVKLEQGHRRRRRERFCSSGEFFQSARQRQGSYRHGDDRGSPRSAAFSRRTPSSSSRLLATTPASRWRSSQRQSGYQLILTMPETMSVRTPHIAGDAWRETRADARRGRYERRDCARRSVGEGNAELMGFPQQFNNQRTRPSTRRPPPWNCGTTWTARLTFWSPGSWNWWHDYRLRRRHPSRRRSLHSKPSRLSQKILAGHFADARGTADQARPAQDSRHGRGICSGQSAFEGQRGQSADRRVRAGFQRRRVYDGARRLAKEEGILVGISTGANVVAAY